MLFPADITLTKDQNNAPMNVSIQTENDEPLPDELNVTVMAESQNGAKLIADNIEGKYQVDWTTGGEYSGGTLTASSPAITAAVFKFESGSNMTQEFTLTQSGTASLVDDMQAVKMNAEAKPGTLFKDTITFTVNDATPKN